MKIATANIIRNIDKYCSENVGIPGIVLMEKAAERVVNNISLDDNNSFAVICGSGNNGGDGLAVARQLYCLGKHVEVFMFGINNLSADCDMNYNIIRNLGLKINIISGIEDIEHLRELVSKCDITIDAIFGTGLRRNIEGIYDLAITVINENSSNILSIDVPSGFHSDSGKTLGNCIRANRTITFQLYKRGFINYNTDKLLGDIIVEDIGIPSMVVNKFHNNEFMLDRDMIKDKIKRRNKYAHKGDYGRVTIIAGSRGFTGAPVISTQAAVRSGAGLVTLCCSSEIQDVVSSKLLEAMTLNIEDKEKFQLVLEKSNAIAIGPGMGNNENTLSVLSEVVNGSHCPLIIDADSINVLAGNLEFLENMNNKIILTPHLGEMSRITGLTIETIKENRLDVAKEFASKYKVILVLKGYNTVISDGNITVINTTGNSAMANGGMGDCLTGIITSFIAQGYNPMEASCIATYIHGYCGEKLSKEMYCVNASHVLKEIPYCINEIMK
jgi:ADP-dependent NAD(P)H-hydrate dehydratase / NAD(P)H-hydrate epimerase